MKLPEISKPAFLKVLAGVFVVWHIPIIQTVEKRDISKSKLASYNDCALLVNHDSAGSFSMASVYIMSHDGETLKKADFFGPLYYFLFRGTSGGVIVHRDSCEQFK